MIDLTNNNLTEALEFAKSINDTTLQDCLNRLELIDKNLGSETTICDDFAPYSFEFSRNKDGHSIGDGGIIFHGKHDNGGDGSAPTFSVSLDNDTTPRWQIHT